MQAQVCKYSHLSLSDTGHTGTGQLQTIIMSLTHPRSMQELRLPAPQLTPQGEVD